MAGENLDDELDVDYIFIRDNGKWDNFGYSGFPLWGDDNVMMVRAGMSEAYIQMKVDMRKKNRELDVFIGSCWYSLIVTSMCFAVLTLMSMV